jgi:hypothetical protein
MPIWQYDELLQPNSITSELQSGRFVESRNFTTGISEIQERESDTDGAREMNLHRSQDRDPRIYDVHGQ